MKSKWLKKRINLCVYFLKSSLFVNFIPKKCSIKNRIKTLFEQICPRIPKNTIRPFLDSDIIIQNRQIILKRETNRTSFDKSKTQKKGIKLNFLLENCPYFIILYQKLQVYQKLKFFKKTHTLYKIKGIKSIYLQKVQIYSLL